jgi:hypothetical protein
MAHCERLLELTVIYVRVRQCTYQRTQVPAAWTSEVQPLQNVEKAVTSTCPTIGSKIPLAALQFSQPLPITMLLPRSIISAS